jgi:hypothetical protein
MQCLEHTPAGRTAPAGTRINLVSPSCLPAIERQISALVPVSVGTTFRTDSEPRALELAPTAPTEARDGDLGHPSSLSIKLPPWQQLDERADAVGGRQRRRAYADGVRELPPSRRRAESRGGRDAFMVVGRAQEATTSAGPVWDEVPPCTAGDGAGDR